MKASTSSSSRSSRRRTSIACLSCKVRRCKCSGSNPCVACSRSGRECLYDATLDKRRKIHWKRTETESTLQKEMLYCLLDLISSEDEETQRRLKDDAHIQVLAQRLGIEEAKHALAPSHLIAPDSRTLSPTGKTSIEHAPESQIDELTRRQATSRTGSHSGDQLTLLTLCDTALQSPKQTDPRDKYRIFRSGNIPSIESVNVFGYLRFPPAAVITSYGPTLQCQQMINIQIPEYLVQPLLFEQERSPTAALYTDFRDYGRKQLAAGLPVEVVLGSSPVDVNLYFRERRPEDPYTPATWACEYIRLLKDLDIYVALAWIYTSARFMRWVIAPSAETYALLPDVMRPTPLQRLVRHHPEADLPIFPEMRDGLVRDLRDYVIATQTLGCSVNWECGLDAAIDINLEAGTLTLSDKFVKHACDLSHWSISQRLADVFPEMRGHYDVVEHDTIPVSKVDVAEFLRQ